MRRWLLLGALLWAWGGAQERPLQWLQRAQQAEDTLTVAGVRVTELRVGRSVQRIEERFWRQGARAERIEILAPPARQGEVLLFREGRWLVYRPAAKEAFELPRMPLHGALMLQIAGELLREGIVQAEVLNETALLGRSCVVLRLSLTRPDFRRAKPPEKRPPFPATVTLWIDRETGLLLRREVAMHPNAPALRTEITRLEMNPRLAPELFTLPPGVVVRPLGGAYKTLEEAQRAVAFPIRTPAYLPEGTTLERVLVRGQPTQPNSMVILHYRTPRGRFSLFQAYKTRDAHFQHHAKGRPGRLNTYFWQEGDYSFGIVGSLPQSELEKIARSLGRATP